MRFIVPYHSSKNICKAWRKWDTEIIFLKNNRWFCKTSNKRFTNDFRHFDHERWSQVLPAFSLISSPSLQMFSSNLCYVMMMQWIKKMPADTSEQRQQLHILKDSKVSLTWMSPFWIIATLLMISIRSDFLLMPDIICTVVLSRYTFIF